ncbi:hypothetical protein Ocin01_06651 [Orchesella cincta]|uniref:Uncharacterized protein n=1 Tax=Orchesella cincta TaxID=48709 RepID=A0A1D2N417_ORCCI|nr:hypothetical protein Ocin01_06651 [Orchesella cincta]
MNFKVILIAVAVIAVAHAQDFDTPRRTRNFKIDIREPITKIKEKLVAVYFKPIEALKAIVDILLGCLLPSATSSLLVNRQVAHHPIATEFEKLAVTLEFNPPPLPFAGTYNLSNYCNTTGFRMVHNHLIDDEQWADLLKFFYTYGFPEVYQAFIDLYTASKCPQDLTDSLPTGPSSTVKVQSSSRSNIRNEVLASDWQLYQEQTCNIANITTELLSSGLLSVADLIETGLTQVLGNPSMHLLVGKIQEPVKGPSFREFRLLAPINGVIAKANEELIANPIWKIIITFIKNLIGIDFFKTNLVGTLVSIAEYLLWGTPFPLPIPNPSV